MDPYCIANSPRRFSLLTLLGLLAVLLSVIAAPTRADDPEPKGGYYQIESGDAPQTLQQFSSQSGTQVLFDYQVLRDFKTKAIKGAYAPNEALTRMLLGTGLQFKWVNSNTVAIERSNPVRRGHIQPH